MYTGVVERGSFRFRPGARSRTGAHNRLLPTWGHASDGSAKGKSTSLLLAQAMGQLRRERLLEYRTWKPTGYWAKNSTISYWARPPGPEDAQRLTWHQYALGLGLDPDSWNFS